MNAPELKKPERNTIHSKKHKIELVVSQQYGAWVCNILCGEPSCPDKFVGLSREEVYEKALSWIVNNLDADATMDMT